MNIDVSNTITIDGESSDGGNSAISSQVSPETIGNGGNIIIATENLNLTNGGEVSTSTFGEGNAGLIEINARDTITIDGVTSEGFASAIESDVTSEGVGNSGDITIDAGNLAVTNGAEVSSGTRGQGNAGNINISVSDSTNVDGEDPDGFSSEISSSVGTSGIGDGGLIEINATELISVDGESSDGFSSVISSQVDLGGIGNAGGVNIFTNKLSLTNGGQIDSSTLAKGNAGLIAIDASDLITIDGSGSDESGSRIVSSVGSEAVGNSEGINITTNNLDLTNGGSIQTGLLGQGNSGSIRISTTESLSIGKEVLNSPNISFITSRVNSGAEGDAGSIDIITSNLTLTNGAAIDAATFGNGNAGLVTIEASDSIVIDGEGSNGFSSVICGQVSTSIFGQGDAGDITVNASESIIIDGRDTSLVVSGVEVDTFRGGLTSSLLAGNGSGGNIDVSTKQLTINNGNITADDSLFIFNNPELDSGGQPGNININANSIDLNQQAFIRAFTKSETGNSANINLTVAEDITLRNNSSISAQALENANGGNLTIDANEGFILVFPNQNNDIIANAAQGNGGNIEIFTQAIFGLEERSSTPPNKTNDIDASSEFGLQGDFTFNTPDFDPTSGLINLPASVGDASDQISQNPCQQGVGSQFIVTGKGGLPPNPTESLNSDRVKVGLVEPVPSQRQSEGETKMQREKTNNQATEAVPAMGWVFNDKGEVTLTAYSTSENRIQRSEQKYQTTCQSRINR